MAMTLDIILVLGVLVLVILFFVFEWVRVDMVGIMVMVTLPLLGLVSPKQAVSGLSSNAVVSIIAVIIIGAGLEKSGVMNHLARLILKFTGKSEYSISAVVSGTVALISGFMQNIGAAALFMPAARRIAVQTGIPLAHILLPMAFCAIIGGTLTLVGSSPLILLNDLLVMGDVKYEPFGLFSMTPVGIMLLISALIYFALFGKWILPACKRSNVSGPLSPLLDKTYHEVGQVYEMYIPEDGFEEKSLIELQIRSNYACSVVASYNHVTHKRNVAPRPQDTLCPGDSFAVIGDAIFVEKLAKDFGWTYSKELKVFADDLSPANAGIMEGIVSPRSQLVGKTIAEFHLREKYGVVPLAVFIGHEVIISDLSDLTISEGNALLLCGKWSAFHRLKDQNDLVFTEQMQGEILREDKAKWALGVLAVSMFMILVLNIQLSIALLFGAMTMVLGRVLTLDEAYQAVDWMTVFLLAGLIPLGMAFENTGAAKLIADVLMGLVGVPSPTVLLLSIGALTSFFTLFISNVGATVLLVPLAMNLAIACGGDPRVSAMTVALAASNTFILPTHQVNALVMRPAGLRSVDYLRAGAGMTVIFLFILVAGMRIFF
ncbi:SLC13 family permease [Maridesulfovibrio hydrothermalis]|uniref:Citrate transporter n=1 Tax=Maridesulfovibrio hydrothermalis AM13 = DSM 14728 TaxID=1121451 RepID=L0RBC7_9BACT|nr:SLC13 family permease [Maridesulfovibrio hydrothermalis]CCO24093.1 Citrate transporter [Maridesulfovibrio hydrothermalis AM13 = DSM 14728]